VVRAEVFQGNRPGQVEARDEAGQLDIDQAEIRRDQLVDARRNDWHDTKTVPHARRGSVDARRCLH